jgi:hypothetical protein
VKENMFMYSSSLHIFYVLLQCNMDIMSLNHYLMYVVGTINYLYVLFQLSQVFSIWNIYFFKSIYFK